MHMPDNIDKALNMAIVATNAEKEEKTLSREDRGTSARVFTVGGSRGGIPKNRYENRYERPEEDFNGAIIEVPGHRIGLDRHNARQRGTGPPLAGLTAGFLWEMIIKRGP
jgi:hypothetical protein